MIKYEDIAKANEAIKTTKIERKDKKTGEIQSKDYAEVNQRIKAFRMCHPNGTITTDIISIENGVVLMKASVYDEDEKVLGSGYAYEKENSTFINQTSYIENCETSAVGRALGMCGFGIDTSVASYEEVSNAMANQGDQKEKLTKKATPKQVEKVKELVSDIPKMLEYYKVEKIEDLSIEQASEIIAKKGAKK